MKVIIKGYSYANKAAECSPELGCGCVNQVSCGCNGDWEWECE